MLEAQPGSEAERYDASLVLVRPDQFVAWAGLPATLDAAAARDLLVAACGGLA